MNSLYERNIELFRQLIPEAHWAVECWHNECVRLGRPFTVSEAYRTVERQKQLYAQGRTKPGPIVTERDGVRLVSDHQLRLAVDIYPNCAKKYQAEWYRDIEQIAAKYWIKHPYTKGRFIDLPHFTVEGAKPRPTPSATASRRRLEREIKNAVPPRKDRLLDRLTRTVVPS